MASNQVEIVLRAVDQASAALKAAKDGLGGIDAQAKVTRRTLQQLGDSMVRLGSQLSLRVTAPIMLAGTAALKMGGDFEAAMNRVAALSGATGDQLDALTAKARDLGATTSFSASQAADAMGFMAMAGMRTDDILGSMESTLRLAAAAQLDMGAAADIVTNVLSGYGMEVSELDHAVDVLTKSFTSANTDLTQLAEAMTYAGPVANSAGIQFEEAAAAIGLMGNAGIQGSMAGTSLRGAITRLLTPTSRAAEIMQELGITATDSEGRLLPLADLIEQLGPHADNTAAFMEIFGQRAGPAMAALVGQGADALRDLTTELENSGGTAERIANAQMEGLNGALKLVRSAAEALAISIANSGLIEWAEGLARNIANLLQRASEMNPVLLRTGTIIAGVAAALGPLLIAVGGFIRILPVLRANLIAVRTVMLTLSTPIMVAIAAALALKVAWDRNFLGIQETTARVVEWLGRAFNTVVAFGSSLIRNWDTIVFAWGQIQESLGHLARLGGEMVAAGWEVGTLAVQRAFTAMFRFVEQGLSSMVGGITDGINAVIRGINRTIGTEIPEVARVALSAWADIDAQTSSSLNAAQERVANAQANMGTEVRFIQSTVATATDIIVGGMNDSGDAVEALGEVATGVGTTVQEVIDNLTDGVDDLTTGLGTDGLAGALGDGATEAEKLAAQLAEIEARLTGITMLRARSGDGGLSIAAIGSGWDPFQGAPGPAGIQTARREYRPRAMTGATYAGSPRGDAIERAAAEAEAALIRSREVSHRIYTDTLREGAANGAAREQLQAETDAIAARAAGFANAIDLNVTAANDLATFLDDIGAAARRSRDGDGGLAEAARITGWDPFADAPGLPGAQTGRRAYRTRDMAGVTYAGSPRGDAMAAAEAARANQFGFAPSDRGRRRDEESDGGLEAAALIVAAQKAQADATERAQAALGVFKDSLLQVAIDGVPGFKAALDGFAQGGPVGALTAVFFDLLGRSQGFADLLDSVNVLLQPLIDLVGQAATAFIPLVEALQPLVQLIVTLLQPAMSLLGWLMGGLANVISGIVDVFIDIYNFLLGWLFGTISKDGGGGTSVGLITALQEERQELVEAIANATSEQEIARLNARLAELDAELARLRGLGSPDDGGNPTSTTSPSSTSTNLGDLPPMVQFAIATPLRQAADTLMEAAVIIRDVYAGPEVRATASTRTFSGSVERFGDYVERLVTEGIRVMVEGGSGPSGTSTAALR